MRQRLYTVLLAVLVVATGVVAAPGAVAATGHFTAESYPAELIGEQGAPHVFQLGAAEATCLGLLLKGTLAAESEELTLAPEYSSCHVSVGGSKFPTTVTENGCSYRLNGTTKLMDLLCPVGKKINIHVYADNSKHASAEPFCTYTIGEQNTLKGVEYENKGTGTSKDLSIESKITGIAYVRHGGGLLCTNEEGNTATYSGTATLEAFSGAKRIALDIG